MSSKLEERLHTEGYQHINTVVNTATSMMDKVRSGELKPLFTSLQKETDKIGGIFPSDQMVIAGRTGTGKTAKAIHDILDYANPILNPYYADKLIILYDSYEMAAWRGVLRMISGKGEIEAKALLDYNKRLTEERFNGLKILAQSLKGLPIFISTRPKNVRDWHESKKQIQGKFPQHYILNLFDHARLVLKGEESKEEERLTSLMTAGMDLKNNFNMFNIFLSQMNRSIETSVNRNQLGTVAPVLSDLFGGDSISQCADIVLALHRPGMYGLEEFEGTPTGASRTNPDIPDDLLVECVLKQREGWTGKLMLKHKIAINKFEDYIINKSALALPDGDF